MMNQLVDTQIVFSLFLIALGGGKQLKVSSDLVFWFCIEHTGVSDEMNCFDTK